MYIPFLVRSFRIRCLIFCSVLSVVDSLDKCGSRDVVIEMPLTVSSALWLIFLAAYFKESVRSLTWLLIRSVVLFVLSWRLGFASYATAGLNNEPVGGFITISFRSAISKYPVRRFHGPDDGKGVVGFAPLQICQGLCSQGLSQLPPQTIQSFE